jgi:hypothetical protein
VGLFLFKNIQKIHEGNLIPQWRAEKLFVCPPSKIASSTPALAQRLMRVQMRPPEKGNPGNQPITRSGI